MNMTTTKKHSKFKNTGLLFEIIVQSVTSELVNGSSTPASANLIKEYFYNTSELSKELNLYNQLLDESFSKEEDANKLIDLVIAERRKLNNTKLREQKYNLVKEINDLYSEDFYESRVKNYKVYASIYKLFEYALGKTVAPADVLRSKSTIVEHIVNKKEVSENTQSEMIKEYSKLDETMKTLVYKLLIEKFNNKYDCLNSNQKALLKEYINSVTNKPKLKEYIDSEVIKVKKLLEKYTPVVDNDVVKIKINEANNRIDEFMNCKNVTDNHVVMLLNYYQLVQELKELNK